MNFKKLQRKYLLAQVGYTFSDKIKLFALGVAHAFYRKGYVKTFPRATVRLQKDGRWAWFTLTCFSDLSIIYEVFVKHEYGERLPKAPLIMLDLGANTGVTSVFYKLLYPDVAIYSLELSPVTYKALVKNMAQFGNSVTPILAGIGNETGEREISLADSSLSVSLYGTNEGKILSRVQTITMEDFLKRYNINKVDLIKFDIEGAEYDLAKSLEIIKSHPQLVGEIHFDLLSEKEGEYVTKKLCERKVSWHQKQKKGRFVITTVLCS